MRYWEAPDYGGYPYNDVSIFLAGGITRVHDWQKIVAKEIGVIPYLTIYNPRRREYHSLDFRATRAPQCNGGQGCDRCNRRWALIEEVRNLDYADLHWLKVEFNKIKKEKMPYG